MIIKITTENIFDYILGWSPYDAIERGFNKEQRLKYDLYDDFVHDVETSKKYPQSETYSKYMQEVAKLKTCYKQEKPTVLEVYNVCEEIAEISPRQINLDYPQ